MWGIKKNKDGSGVHDQLEHKGSSSQGSVSSCCTTHISREINFFSKMFVERSENLTELTLYKRKVGVKN